MSKIHIVITTFNHRQEINDLSHALFRDSEIAHRDFKLTVMDKGSTDGTIEYVRSIQHKIPLTIETSTPDIFDQRMSQIMNDRTYTYVAVIDPNYVRADTVFAYLLSRLTDSTDILLANIKNYTSQKSRMYSGVGIFRQEIVDHILTIGPIRYNAPVWSLIQYAKTLGYPIQFEDYPDAITNTVVPTVQKIIFKLKLGLVSIPPYNNRAKSKSSMLGSGVHYKRHRYTTHSTLPYRHSAILPLTAKESFMLTFVASMIVIGLLFNFHAVLIDIFAALVILYFADLFFNTYIIFKSFLVKPEIVIPDEALSDFNRTTAPSVSILCPLYKEARILPQFIHAMSDLDYPKDKLQVLLLIESDDTDTLHAAETAKLPEYIRVLPVPYSLPRTKPKALNYGLTHTVGEYIGIYDAEDIPEKNQVMKAILAFRQVTNKVFCLQAKLNFYNTKQNVLTKLFTAEYSTWFDLILTGLYSINAPIPLGCTSNFFRKKDIVSIHGWDAFNVCEDCDLGLRLYKRGYNTALFNSTTYEEANSDLNNWIRQRSHWIKGYIQSFFVHVRSPKDFIRSLKEPHFITFLLIIGGKTLSVFINPFLWILTLSYFVFRPFIGGFIESLFPAPIFYMGMFTLILGNFIYLYNYMLGCAQRGYWHLIKYGYLVPFYWLLMSVAAWKALYQFIFKPFYWEKTNHGLHLGAI